MSDDFYDEESTSASFNELKKLLIFLDKLGVPRPAITGGWAVYAYEKGKGSRDIDVVMVTEEDAIQQLYNNYFPANNFKIIKKGFFPDHWEKIVKTGNGVRDIVVDVFYGNKYWKDEVYLDLKFFWGWTLEFQEKQKIDNLEIIVPKRELLLITKMMAAVARSKENDIKPHYRLPPKISKDYGDVARLTIRDKIDYDFYKDYAKKSNAVKYVDEFLSKYKQEEFAKILETYESNFDEIESILKI